MRAIPKFSFKVVKLTASELTQCLRAQSKRFPEEWHRNQMVYRPLRYEQMMRAAEAYDVRARRMFGGMGVYTGEKMFAFLVGEDIGLKLCPEDVDEAMKLPGAGPMRPDKDAEPMREYVRMPREVLDNLESFMFWVERSASYARRKLSNTA